LASNIVAAILDETLPPEVTLFDLASGMPLWEKRWTLLSARGSLDLTTPFRYQLIAYWLALTTFWK
jgi:hypothetical protein